MVFVGMTDHVLRGPISLPTWQLCMCVATRAMNIVETNRFSEI